MLALGSSDRCCHLGRPGFLRRPLAALLAVTTLGLCAGGCSQVDPEPREARAMRDELQRTLTAQAATDPPPPAWVQRLGQPPIRSGTAGPPPWRIARAPDVDAAYDSDDMEPVRRLIYRVSFLVPPAFRQRQRLLGAHRGELQLDVGKHRLRARFLGPGWPVAEGSEVRLRDEVDGVYAFDGAGGRFLAPGRMASWFEGHTDGRSRSRIRVRRDYKPIPNPGPGQLVCSLLAEWTGQRRDLLAGRCRGNLLPPGFRFGPWSADLTAVVPMELPRRQLRADELEPPRRPPAGEGRFLITKAARERLSGAVDAGVAAGPSSVLTVHNRTPARVVLMIEGVPAAIVDARSSVPLQGLSPGTYRIGVMRPFGVFVRAAMPVEVPGEIVLGAPAVVAAPDAVDAGVTLESGASDPAGSPVADGP